ncbi:MAG: hypothetical protein OEP52_07695 [Acidimicrobiia bacterium]|nr:hypothetical protein [Acidimicrobiia bacterium]
MGDFGQVLRRQLRELGPLLAVIYVPTMVALGLLVVVNVVTNVPLRSFFIDPVSEFNAPMYIGLVSNFGVVLWASAASVCLFAGWLLLKNDDTRSHGVFLVASGLISGLLMFDDLYLLHEEVLPERLHIPQPLVFAAYGVMVVGYLVRFRRLIMESDFALLFLACGFFAASLLVDVFVTPEEFLLFDDYPGRHLVEDGLKLLGIVGWTAYYWRLPTRMVRSSIGPAGML